MEAFAQSSFSSWVGSLTQSAEALAGSRWGIQRRTLLETGSAWACVRHEAYRQLPSVSFRVFFEKSYNRPSPPISLQIPNRIGHEPVIPIPLAIAKNERVGRPRRLSSHYLTRIRQPLRLYVKELLEGILPKADFDQLRGRPAHGTRHFVVAGRFQNT